MDDAPHVGNDGHRRHIGAQHEDPRATALKRVHVDRPRRRFVEIPILRVADDADDLERSGLTLFSVKPFTVMNRLPAAPEMGVMAASVAERTPAIEVSRSSTCRLSDPICAGG